MKAIRKPWPLLLLVLVALAMLVFLDSTGAGYADGAFPLVVSLEAPTGRSIRRVEAQPCVSSIESDAHLADPASPELNLKAVAWSPGRPFEVRVPCSSRISMLGRELSYSRHRVLLLRVELDDGSHRMFAVDLPNGRDSRSLNIRVPDA